MIKVTPNTKPSSANSEPPSGNMPAHARGNRGLQIVSANSIAAEIRKKTNTTHFSTEKKRASVVEEGG